MSKSLRSTRCRIARRVAFAFLLIVPLLLRSRARADGAPDTFTITVDCSRAAGKIRPLHGVNNGPLDVGGTVDLSAEYRALGFPSVRLHDAHWPNPDVVDLSVVFPDSSADPQKPEGYDFVRTDAYLKPIIASGAKITYRLGESIVHDPDKRKVKPPADPDKWAAICLGVVRHYHDGWAGGMKSAVPYWEIWNEPDNRPAQWTGTDEEYFRLYATTARAIKQRYPELKVGGPAIGNTGQLLKRDDGPQLDAPPFLIRFLEFCKREQAPLDFFSWHLYSADANEPRDRALAVRRLLKAHGFEKAESHLTEWNYLPDNDWKSAGKSGQGPARTRFYDRIGDVEGSAFTIAALLKLQDSPLDVANYYAGDTNPWGLFDRHGTPRKNYHALKAFKRLTETPNGVTAVVPADATEWTAKAGLADDNRSLHAVLVRTGTTVIPERQSTVTLAIQSPPWEGPSRCELFVVDQKHDLEGVSSTIHPAGNLTVEHTTAGPAILLIRLTPAGK